MASIIEIKGLSKQYGKLSALHDLTLDIDEGAVVGFIGPNGAGKTTTLRILTTLLKPNAGEAWIAGHSIRDDPQGVRRVIGYMPDFFGVYDDMKVWEYLDFFSACYKIPQVTRRALIDDLLTLVDLNHKKDVFVDSLSRGMKQRLCLARTLAHDPQILILDEPASGLDPRARIEIRELLRELKRMGKTIFFSSHILSEVADVCTNIAILEAGKLVTYGNMAEMKSNLRPHRMIQLRTIEQNTAVMQVISGNKHVQGKFVSPENDLPPSTVRFEFTGNDQQLSDLLTSLVDEGIAVISFSEEQGDLEDVFMQVTRGIVS